jgi:hypothetical protein
MGMQTHEAETAYDSTKSDELNRILALNGQACPNPRQIEKAVKQLCAELKRSDKRISPLAEDRDSLIELFDYAERAWNPLEIRYFNESQSRFGAGYVAPTSMGNVAESMQNRALSRYNLDLEMFWSRLQVVIQGQQDKGFFTSLQDAKTQLDFLVACCWLSGLTWFAWALVMLIMGDNMSGFLLAALVGPAVSYFFYALAIAAYQTMADLINSGVDLYRFSLLQALHVPLPKGIHQERILWQTLRDFSSFGQDVELSYNQDSKGAGP